MIDWGSFDPIIYGLLAIVGVVVLSALAWLAFMAVCGIIGAPIYAAGWIIGQIKQRREIA